MDNILNKKGFICDMDGVIYHGSEILDGVADFVNWMIENDKKFVFLTDKVSSSYTGKEVNTRRGSSEIGSTRDSGLTGAG